MILENGYLKIDTIHQGDCLELMPFIADKSINLILSDLPYGTTACHWDQVIPFEPLWKEYKRLIKDRGAIVLTASQPFTSALVMSNIKQAKHFWIWLKERGTGFQVAKYRPMMATEDVIAFCAGDGTFAVYNPQMNPLRKRTKEKNAGTRSDSSPILHMCNGNRMATERHPTNVIPISRDQCKMHPTQKPVALFEYLIKTYTNEGDLVLDNCIGSGTTAVAAKRTGRHFIGIELSEEYCEMARKRVASVPARLDRWEDMA